MLKGIDRKRPSRVHCPRMCLVHSSSLSCCSSVGLPPEDEEATADTLSVLHRVKRFQVQLLTEK